MTAGIIGGLPLLVSDSCGKPEPGPAWIAPGTTRRHAENGVNIEIIDWTVKPGGSRKKGWLALARRRSWPSTTG
jgi:hypothetical protein